MARREGGKDTGARGVEECKEDQGLHERWKCRRDRGDRGREGRRLQRGGWRGDQRDGCRGYRCRGDQRGWIKGGQRHSEGMDAGGKKGINSRVD